MKPNPLKVKGFYEIVKVAKGGILATLCGVPELGTVYVPLHVTGFVAADTERGVPDMPSWAVGFLALQLKGQGRYKKFTEVLRTERGLRAQGWGGLYVYQAYRSMGEEVPKNARLYVRDANSSEILRDFGLFALAAEKDAAAAEILRKQQEAEAEMLRKQQEAEAEAERKRQEAEAEILRKQQEAEAIARKNLEDDWRVAIALRMPLADFQALTAKQKRLALHRARLKGLIS